MKTFNSHFPLIKRAGQMGYRLLERMSERAYRTHRAHLLTRYAI
ncbi:hypothetical protein SAMN05192555_11238 [Franzmannia pantelleriensis]|uniref:Uncharacterized protein n=1 Tax=Franzmannia pantelleriensis TaxID=48727 RepID=A0A1G9SHG4_9GAMM|nr:hypothetical protein [Halomonas pantelleriensis]SDM34938.1 hypothetical protein SAMN05192555_11238 [Halomonas pantelleriensis]